MSPMKPFQQVRMPGQPGGMYPMAPARPQSMMRMPGIAGGQYWQPPGQQAAQTQQDPLLRAMRRRPAIALGGR